MPVVKGSPTRRDFLGGLLACGGALAARPAGVLADTPLEPALSRAARVVHRADPDYEPWRASMVWYLARPARKPQVIVRAGSEDDALVAVRYAAAAGLRIAPRTTGHNPARSVLRDGGLLLDLSRLQAIDIDADAGTAWVHPGVRSEAFVAAAGAHGWSFPAAHTGIVGLGGYLLGGGLGWNMQAWDIACRSIVAADVVLADGRRRRVDTRNDPDLLWAIRGAGPGFFGAVLRYQVRLRPAPKTLVKTRYVIPIARLPAALAALEDVTAAKARALEILAVVGRFAPPDRPVAQRDLVCVVSGIAFADSPAHARELVAPLAASALPALATAPAVTQALTWPALYAGQVTDYSSPRRIAVSNQWTDRPAQVLAVLADRLQRLPPASPHAFALSAWGVNPARDDADSCFTYAADHYVSWYLMADRPQDEQATHDWMDGAIEHVRPYARGHYVNEIDPGRYPALVEASYAPAKWQRLADLRRRHDPGKLFHTWLGRD